MEPPAGPPNPTTYGIGARISLHPMTDRYVDVILGALRDTAHLTDDLDLETGSVSTFAGGDEQSLVDWLCALVTAATSRADGAHLGVTIMLSRGCPGEVMCTLKDAPWASDGSLWVAPTGVHASAEWSLYPLLDGGEASHMKPIMDAIETARRTGLYAGSDHYVTRLSGDVADIVSLVTRTWRETGASVQHVTTHLALSINSPTEKGNPA